MFIHVTQDYPDSYVTHVYTLIDIMLMPELHAIEFWNEANSIVRDTYKTLDNVKGYFRTTWESVISWSNSAKIGDTLVSDGVWVCVGKD